MKRTAPPTPPPDGVIKSLGHLVQKADSAAGKPVFRITSEVLDRHNDRVKGEGLKTEAFDKNPVLLWNHNDGVPAIGTARVFQEGGEWFMEPTFDGIGELSKDVAAKVAAGTLRTCSIRFRFLQHSYNEEGGLDYEECELLEISITNIPANPEAHRVKTQGQQQKSDTPTPPESEAAKANEAGDMEAIRALVREEVAEALKPLAEALARLEAALPGKQTDEPGTEDAGKAEEEDEPGTEDAGKAEEEDEPAAEEPPVTAEKSAPPPPRRGFLFCS